MISPAQGRWKGAVGTRGNPHPLAPSPLARERGNRGREPGGAHPPGPLEKGLRPSLTPPHDYGRVYQPLMNAGGFSF